MNSAARGAHNARLQSSAAHSDAVDHNAILNVIRLAHAQSQKLAEQWVPITKEEFEQENGNANLKESFPFRPEQAGLGADTSQAATSDWKGVSVGNTGGAELEKLRRQLLGRKAGPKAGIKKSARQPVADGAIRKKEPLESISSSDDDEEGGRAAAFTSKRVKSTLSNLKPSEQQTENYNAKPSTAAPTSPTTEGNVGLDGVKKAAKQESGEAEESDASSAQQTNISPSANKRHLSFLDQILIERSNKKRRKRKKHKQRGLDKT